MLLCLITWKVLTAVSAEFTDSISTAQMQSKLCNIRKELHLQENLISGTFFKKN